MLPGPRALWWVLALLSVSVPLAAQLLGGAEPITAEQPDAMTAELRGRTFIWRLLTNTQPQQPAAAPVADARVKAAEDKDWQELVGRARQMDAVHADKPTDAREQLVVHALAVEHPERAVALAREVTLLSDDTRAVLTGLPGIPTATAMDKPRALAQLRARAFGHGWSTYQRDRARQLAYERLDDLDGARAMNKSLRARDNRVVPAWSTAALLFLAALFVGGTFWAGAAMRAFRALPTGPAGARGWVRSRYPGLPRDLPYITDPLLPWLGFGGWLSGYLMASLALASLAGQRSMSGLGVLFQAGVGALTAIAVVQTFARHPPGLPHAARLGTTPRSPLDPPQISLPRAFLAALRVMAALLPVMAVTVLLLAVFGVMTAEHPVSGMVLNDVDPLQLASIGAAVTLVAPLGEELIFRGFFYRALRMRLGVWPALLITSLAFSALHPSLGPYLVLSGAFCLAYEWTGSLWTSILLHGLWNLLSFGVLIGVAVS